MTENNTLEQTIIEGVFQPVYYNECEAGYPLGTDYRCTLCELIKDKLISQKRDYLESHPHERENHSLVGKSFKIIVYDSSDGSVTDEMVGKTT